MKAQLRIRKTDTQRLLSSNVRLFQIFFLMEDENQSVKVINTDKINFEEIAKHLKSGGSVFITPKTRT